MDNTPSAYRPRYLPLPLKTLRSGTRLPADIFVRPAPGQYMLCASMDSPVNPDMKAQIAWTGFTTVYVPHLHCEALYDYLEKNLRRIIEGDGNGGGDSAAFIFESADSLMRHLWEHTDTTAALQRVRTAVEAAVWVIMQNKSALRNILNIAGHDYYTYTHCIHVSALMIAACDIIFSYSKKQLLSVGLGAMLHDIGKRNIPGNILKKPGSLSLEEFRDIMKHPMWGLELAEEAQKIRRHARGIIMSHHERFEGGGYPAGIPSKNLDEPTRMAKIVDVYDALTNHRPYGPAITPQEAVNMMQTGMDGHFDGRLLREFVAFMGMGRN